MYTELHAHSHFSFLDGAASPEALATRAAALGMHALALTDHQGLYGAVKHRNACHEAGVRPVYGTAVALEDGGSLTLLVQDATGWANLCRLLSAAGLAGSKHERPVPWTVLEQHTAGLICLTGANTSGALARPARAGDRATTLATGRRLRDLFGRDRCYVEIQRHLADGERRVNATLAALAEHLGLGLVATNNVHHAIAEDLPLQHVLTCIRHLTNLDEAGARLFPTPHRHLKGPGEMADLFADLPEAIANTRRIAERCHYELDHSGARLPPFPVPAGETAYSHLHDLCHAGLRRRYSPVSSAAAEQLARELGVIERAGLAEYFLVVHELVAFARERGIVCQGRGSAAGSVVAYALGITPVDPLANGLLFERFLAEGSAATPDIDVDFAADRREEVIQHVYTRYGADRAAMVANVVTFQARSAVWDVGKALGFPTDLLEAVRHAVHTLDATAIAPDLAEVAAFREKMGHLPWRLLVDLCRQIDGCPRHLSIHVGGMIITGRPLAELVPLEPATMPGRVVVQWDKDDVEDAGLIKIDLLSLRTLGMVAESFRRVAEAGGPELAMDSVPPEDPAVYAMLHAADAIGCFQVESRAQMNLLPRLRPTSMADLTVEVSLIRPGPVQGGMAKAYLARRDGDEPVTYWHPLLEPVLAETLGVMVYQEQVLKVAMTLAGFSPAQADGLRRAMSRKRSREAMERRRADFVAGAIGRGVDEATAHQVFDYLLGFASYGFCKSHAAAFALVTYVTCWLKCYWPLPFFCALLNAQPMGFYSVEVVVEDAKRHAIAILPVHVNHSHATWAIEDGALRVPLTRVKGLPTDVAEAIAAARAAHGPFPDLWTFVRQARPPRPWAERLIAAGALDGLPITAAAAPTEGGDRRTLLWALGEMDWPFGALDLPPVVTPAALAPITAADTLEADYRLLGLAQGPHLMALLRPHLADLGVTPSAALAALPDGQRARVAGRIEVVQRPPPAKGIAFVSVEDELGLANLILYPAVYQRYRQVLRQSPVIIAEGLVQHEKGALHLIVDKVAAVHLGADGATSAKS